MNTALKMFLSMKQLKLNVIKLQELLEDHNQQEGQQLEEHNQLEELLEHPLLEVQQLEDHNQLEDHSLLEEPLGVLHFLLLLKLLMPTLEKPKQKLISRRQKVLVQS